MRGYYTQPGPIESRLALVDQGVLGFHYYNNKAENIKSSLIREGDFITPANYFFFASFLPTIYRPSLSALFWQLGERHERDFSDHTELHASKRP